MSDDVAEMAIIHDQDHVVDLDLDPDHTTGMVFELIYKISKSLPFYFVFETFEYTSRPQNIPPSYGTDECAP